MEIDQIPIIHLVNMIAGENGDVLGPLFFQSVNVLVNGVGGPLVPVFVNPLLRRHHVDKFA